MKRTILMVIKQHHRLVLTSLFLIMTLITVLSATLLYGVPGLFAVKSTQAAAAGNPITIENAQPGSTGWQFDYDSKGNPLKATNHEIEGYASATSVNKGGQISFMVSLNSSAQYTMDFYRMGYYPTGTNPDGTSCSGPCGGRLMQHTGPLNGTQQAACPTTTTTTDFGLIECQWSVSYTLTVPTTWTTGAYIVKLRRTDTSKEEYMTFVVRDDSTPADIVLSEDVNTWQAYNFWGGIGNNDVGYNLYGKFDDQTYNNLSSTRAYAVSFDRPYLDQGAQDGAGNLMVWDYPMIRWLEANGYNVTYATDVDIETNPNLLNGRKAFINTGHDEYYSATMRNNLQGYINAGAHIGFFSANNIYFQIRWGNSPSGQAYRRVICYKDQTLDATTIRWRDLSPPQPENSIVGVMQNGVANDRPYEVYDATSWIYAGTGLVNYTGGNPVISGSGQNAIKGLVGYEFDERAKNDASLSSWASYEPSGLQQVGHSNVPALDNGVAAFSDATLYTASSGAIVFAAGTLQWSWGVDNGFNDGFCDCNPGYANSVSQQITANILNKFLSTTATPSPAVSLSPTSVNFGNQLVNTSSATQTVTLTDSGAGALTITSIGLTGTNSGDFAQTNTCPISPSTLAAGASCTISVTFTPIAGGTRTASLTISDNAAGSPQSVALSGSASASGTYFLDGFESGNFSQWTVPSFTGTASVQSTVVNSGSDAASFTNASGQYIYLYNNLASGAQTSSYTRFYFRFASLAGSTPIAFGRDINGNNLWEVDYDANRKGLDTYFWNGARTRYNLFTNRNVVSANTWYSIEVQSTETTSGHGEVWLNGTSIGAVNADLSVTNGYSRLLIYSSATGTAYFDDIKVANSYNGPVNPTPAVSLSPASLSFANQNVGTSSTAQTVTLTNSGTGALTLTGISIGGTNAGDFAQTNTCPISPSTLAAGASCSVSITFTPTVAAARSASLSIADNAAGSPQSVALSGTGVTPTPAVSLSPPSLSYNTQNVGTTSAAQTVTLTDSGAGALTITSIGMTGTNSGDFAQTNNCPSSPSTLAAGASCIINITFAPTDTGTRTASLSISDNAAGSPQSVALSGNALTAGIYFSDGFESGNFSQWTVPSFTGTASVQSTVVNSGSDAASFTNTSGQYTYLYSDLASGAQTSSYTRFYFRFASLAGSTPIAFGRDINGNNLWEVDYDAGRQGLDIYFWNGARTRYDVYSNTNVLSANTWYSIEVQSTETTSGHGEVWLNGTSIGSVNADLSVTNGYARLFLYDEATGTAYFDDVEVANSYI